MPYIVSTLMHLIPFILILISGNLVCAEDQPSLPLWFENNRVQAHLELEIEETLEVGQKLHQYIADSGAEILTSTILNDGEGAWWQSAVGESHELARLKDVGRLTIEDVHKHGMKFIGYFRFMSDEYIEREKPDWLCRDPNGFKVAEPRTKNKKKLLHVICINTPYREFVKKRLEELARRGCDIIYFDSWHMPPVCTCDWCRKKYEKETGRPFPFSYQKLKMNDSKIFFLEDFEHYELGKILMNKSGAIYSPEYLDVAMFVSRSLIETFTYWRDVVKKINPEIRFAIGSSDYPIFTNQPQLTGEFISIADTSKTEFNKPFGGKLKKQNKEMTGSLENDFDLQLAIGWSLVRDSTSGRPPLMWVPAIRKEKEARYSAAAAVTYGCVASLAFPRRPFPMIGGKNITLHADKQASIFRSTYNWGRKVSPHLANRRPYPWAVIHISEEKRNRHLDDKEYLLADLIDPVINAVRVMKEAHIPWATVTDRQLLAGLSPSTRILITPSMKDLSPSLRNALEVARKNMTVIVLDEFNIDNEVHCSSEFEKAILKKMSQEQKANPPLVRVTGSKNAHVMYYKNPDEGKIVIMMSNEFDWFRTIRSVSGRKPEEDPDFIDNLEEPLALFDMRVEIMGEPGKVKSVINAVTGEKLEMKRTLNGVIVTVPPFQISACIVIE